MSDKFSKDFYDANENIKNLKLKSVNEDTKDVEFIAFLEANADFFSALKREEARNRLSELSKMLSVISNYNVYDYLASKDVRYYLLKKRIYTPYQYEVINSLLSFLITAILIILCKVFFSSSEHLESLFIASFIVGVSFSVFDAFENVI